MAKNELKKALDNTLKEAKQYSKTVVKLLKGLKKKDRGTGNYHKELTRAADLFKAAVASIGLHHEASQKVVKKVPVKKKKAVAKKKKK